jgi:hypothetical protein
MACAAPAGGAAQHADQRERIEMLSTCGICVDALVQVNSDCTIECEVIGDEAHMRLGSQGDDGVTLVLGLRALDTLVVAAAHAGHELRARAVPESAAG